MTKAYRALAGNGEHPDNGGNEDRWKLVTAAYTELKKIFSKKRGSTETKSDERWYSAWIDLTRPQSATPPKSGPSASASSDGTVEWKFEDIEGESKEDRRRRYARTRQQFRYATDPDYAKARKEASVRSHKKARDAKKAEKKNTAT